MKFVATISRKAVARRFFSFHLFSVSVYVNPYGFMFWCFCFFLYIAWLSSHRFFSNEQHSNSSSWSRWIPQRKRFPARNRNLLSADNRCRKCGVINDLRLLLLMARKLFKMVLAIENVSENINYSLFSRLVFDKILL